MRAASGDADGNRVVIERRVRELELIGEAGVHVARNVNLQLAMENLAAQLAAGR